METKVIKHLQINCSYGETLNSTLHIFVDQSVVRLADREHLIVWVEDRTHRT